MGVSREQISDRARQALVPYAYHLKQEADLSPATVRNYLGDVELFVAWYEQVWSGGQEVFSPGAIATPTLTRYRDYLKKEQHLKPATINRYLISLKRYFDWAASTARVTRDPARPVKSVDQTPQAPRHLSDKEEGDLVAAVEQEGKPRDIALIVLMLHTGLRVGEACALTWEDVTLQERNGILKVWGKGQKYREVPLNATARQVLAEYQMWLVGQDLKLTGPVFVSQRTRESLTPRGLRFMLDKYARRAGVENLGPHDLRHRFGYRMAEKVPLHRLAQIMGHDSLDTTLTYIRGTQRDLQQAVETIAWK
jgi:integrase/recombinase XerC